MPTERSGRPHANSAAARFISKRIDELRGVKNQREIAAQAGFLRPNVLSMIKTGDVKIPFDRIAALARALEADPAHVLRLAMIDQWPETASVIDAILGKQLASANEHAILLKPWRDATDESDPAPNAQIIAAVERMLAGLYRL